VHDVTNTLRRRRVLAALALGALTLTAACGGADDPTVAGGSAELDPSDWASIEAAADGSTVNWYMFGGADRLNDYVNGYVADQLEAKGVTLNQVKVNDTVEAVNKVLGEIQAGRTEDGTVDLIWINGENFSTLKQADALYCGYVEDLPSAEFVDLEKPGIATDFGVPTEGCEVPWQQATSALVYDSSALTEADVASMDALFAWSQANPGRFTYPAPPDFTGSMVVRTAFLDTAGDADRFLGEFDQEKYDEVAPQTWERLNEVEPSLWRGGETYPQSGPDVEQLFADDEIDAYLTYGSTSIGQLVEDGRFPETTRSAVFEGGTIGNHSFVAIPGNAANKAAAMVLANLLLDPEAALVNAGPEGAGFVSAVELDRLPADLRTEFEQVYASPYQVDPAEAAAKALPEIVPGYVEALEKDWRTNVLQR
jgi:putative spermidine/putrescine transport system substrate-binding protein